MNHLYVDEKGSAKKRIRELTEQTDDNITRLWRFYEDLSKDVSYIMDFLNIERGLKERKK